MLSNTKYGPLDADNRIIRLNMAKRVYTKEISLADASSILNLPITTFKSWIRRNKRDFNLYIIDTSVIRCTLCNDSFIEYAALGRHYQKYHPGVIEKCYYCNINLDENTRSKSRRLHYLCIECCHIRKLEEGRKHNLSNIDKVFQHYGSTCACCGENIKKFLTIDHINNNGNKHRREIGKKSIYR